MEENGQEKNSLNKENDSMSSTMVKSGGNFPLMKISSRQLMVLGGLGLLIIMPIIARYNNSDNSSLESIVIKKEETITKNPFEALVLEAKAVYVLDVAKGKVLYSYNENTRMPLASLTKIMTALVASEMVPQSTVVSVKAEDIALEGDSGLLTNERWRLSDIIDFTLMTSSNDGASAIASVAGSLGQVEYDTPAKIAKKSFVARMNEKAQEMGLFSTYFLNETGLDKNSFVSGAYGTARDVAYLMLYAISSKTPFLEATTFSKTSITSLSNISHTATNTNSSVNAIPGLIASKTGFTELAGGNLVIAFDAGFGKPIVISVLGSSIEGRFSDIEKLSKASLTAITQ